MTERFQGEVPDSCMNISIGFHSCRTRNNSGLSIELMIPEYLNHGQMISPLSGGEMFNVNKNSFGAVLYEYLPKRKVIVKNTLFDGGGQNSVSLIFRTSRWRAWALADGMVECAAPDKIIQRAAVWQKFGGQSMSQAIQSWESSEFEMGPEVRCPYSDKPVAGQKISLTYSDGSVQELVTSASGRGEKQSVMDPASIQINLKDED